MCSKILFCFILYATCEGRSYKEYESKEGNTDESKYFFSDEAVTFYEALHLCQEKGMQLISIETNLKNIEVSNFLNESTEVYWTSANNLFRSEWYWLKGEVLEYQNGLTKYAYGENGIIISKNDHKTSWRTERCYNKYRYICEKLADSVINPQCEDYNKYLVHGNLISDKKYFIGRELITYFKALQVCKSMCMELVSIENEEKNKDIFEALSAESATEIFWSSGYYKPGTSWRWANGVESKYFSWNDREPNNARKNEFCIEILQKDGKTVWNDEPCEEKRMYLCESRNFKG